MTNHAGVPNEDAESTVSDSPSIAMSRRNFLGSMAAFTLALSFHGGTARAAAVIGKSTARLSFEPNAFIRVAADGKVTVISSYLEMGQGTFTGLATLAAEELDVSLSDITVTGGACRCGALHQSRPRGARVQGAGDRRQHGDGWRLGSNEARGSHRADHVRCRRSQTVRCASERTRGRERRRRPPAFGTPGNVR